MASRCLTLIAVAAMVALGAPHVQATHSNPFIEGVSLSVAPIADAVHPSENATFNVTLANPNSLLARTITLAIPEGTLPAGWSYSLAPTVEVPAGANASALLTLYVPDDAGAQRVPFVVEASDDGGHFARQGGNVTVRARATTQDIEPSELPAPELSLSVSTGDTAASGEIVQGELTVRNLDSFGRSVTVEVRPLARDGWSPYVDGVTNRVIPAGDLRVIPLRVLVPQLAEDVTKTFDVSVIPTLGATRTAQWTVTGLAPAPAEEGGDEGATATPSPTQATPSPRGPVSVTFGPNLDVFVEPVELEVASGGSATAAVRLVNTGTSALVVRLVGETPQTWPESAFAFAPAEAVSLAPGDEARVDMTIQTPAGIPVGGSTTGGVSALAEGGLARRATFRILVVDAVPTDATSAATIEAPVAPSTTPGLDGPVALVVVGLAAVGAGAAVIASRPLREKLLWGAAGLYTRLARPDVLGHEDREKLYRLVETTPGIHFHALQRDLGWNTGTLTYHLRVLEKHGFMVSRRDGLYRRFYLSGAAPRKEVFENQGPTGLRADVLEAVRTQPGISQSDLALGLGANKQTVNYHVKALERAGTIRVEKRGRDTYLYPGDGAPVAPPVGPVERERAKL